MAFICFVESRDADLPYMEALTALSLDEARGEAQRIMDQHDEATSALVFEDEVHVLTIVARTANRTSISGAFTPTRRFDSAPRLGK